MKPLLTGALAFIFYFGSCASCVWAIVEFILYLVKDKIFNWWSVWLAVIFGVLALVMFIVIAIFSAKTRSDSYKRFLENRSTSFPQSRFEKRLAEMEEQRKYARKG